MGWQRRAPLLLPAGAALFGLVAFTGELTVAQPLNDQAQHFQMVRSAVQQLHEGHPLPLDGWYPYLNLGMPLFSHYQSLSHVLTAYVSQLFGADATERWAAYLLLALFPVSVYAGARLLGWDRWSAGCAAFLTPLLVSVTGYGFEQSAYLWRGYGLWPQEWGMFLLPLSWGLTWRAVNGEGRLRYALAAAALGLTIALHFIIGYLAILSVGVFVLAVVRQLPRRVLRAAIVVVGAALVVSAILVPLVVGDGFLNRSEFDQNTYWYDSYGAPQVIGWLFTGQVFDAGRFPVVSPLVLLGTGVCLVRWRDQRSRAVLGLLVLSLVLYSGRPTFGLLLNLLPGMSDVQLNRYVMGVQLAGDLVAGVGLAWLGTAVVAGVRSRWPTTASPRALLPLTAALLTAAVVLTLPAWVDRASFARQDAAWTSGQASTDSTDGASLDVLLDDVKRFGGGRTYAGMPNNWGRDYTIGSVPVYTYLADQDVDEVGWPLRLFAIAADNEAYFDQYDPAQYQLYNVRFLVMPVGMQPPVAAQLVATSGRHRLYQVVTSGYVQLVDTSGTITADRSDMARQMQPYLHTQQFQRGVIATVAFPGAGAPHPTQPYPAPALSTSGSSTDVLDQPADGYFGATVHATRKATVMLKVTYDPGWHVTVDGTTAAATYMVVPGFVAVTVPPGDHSVVFEYRSFSAYPLLLGLGVMALIALGIVPWAWRRRQWVRTRLRRR